MTDAAVPGTGKIRRTATNLVSPEAGQVWQIAPPNGYTDNVPWVIVSGVAENVALPGTYNYGVNTGFNLAAGGGSADNTKPAHGDYSESYWVENARGFLEVCVERHGVYGPCVTTANTTAGQGIRWYSLTLRTGQSAVTGLVPDGVGAIMNMYYTLTSVEWRYPESENGPYLSSSPGELTFADLDGNECAFSVDVSYVQITLGSKSLIVQGAQQVNGALSCSSTIAADVSIGAPSVLASGTGSAAILSNGGIAATKSVAASNSLDIYDYSVYGTPTTEPGALNGALRHITQNVGGSLVPSVKDPDGTVHRFLLSTGATMTGAWELASKTIATLPNAAANAKKRFLITDSTPANRQVFSNGSAWYYENGVAV